jgi:hypothetical protein
MNGSTRRGFVTALLGLSALGARPFLTPARAAPEGPLLLPSGSLHLTRLLLRAVDERGVAAITVRRWWEVTFERQGRGIVVSGRQVGTEVKAPPSLRDIVAIEEARDASGMLPLMLSERGVILSASTAPDTSADVSTAMRAAEAMIARQPIPADDKARLNRYLGEVHRAGTGMLETLPGDLLFPTGTPVQHSETLALPDGLTGRFTLSYRAEPQPDAPWLARAERRVVTVIGTSERRAAEVWTLGPPQP